MYRMPASLREKAHWQVLSRVVFHVIPEEGINDLSDWLPLLCAERALIEDEYGKRIGLDGLLRVITLRSAKAQDDDEVFMRQNHAVPGPNGLWRHKLDPYHCLQHGNGTWDCVPGEFS